MSGYFARLSALAQVPTTSARPVGTATIPRSLESDNEIDTTPLAGTAAASVGAFERIHIQAHTTSVSTPPETAAAPAVPAAGHDPESGLPVTQPMPVAPIEPTRLTDLTDTAIPNQTRQAAPTTFSDVESLPVIQGGASSDLAPMIDVRLSPEPRASFASLADADTANQPGAHGSLALAVPRPDVSASAVMVGVHVDGQTGNGSPVHHREMVRPDVLVSRSESFSAYTPPGAIKTTSRAEVRIGTIALEVRVAPPPSAAAGVAAAAKEPVTPQQFSPHRHYLRWS